MAHPEIPPPLRVQKTPSGESLVKTRKLAKRLESDKRLRRAVAAVIKALGLPPPETSSK